MFDTFHDITIYLFWKQIKSNSVHVIGWFNFQNNVKHFCILRSHLSRYFHFCSYGLRLSWLSNMEDPPFMCGSFTVFRRVCNFSTICLHGFFAAYWNQRTSVHNGDACFNVTCSLLFQTINLIFSFQMCAQLFHIL